MKCEEMLLEQLNEFFQTKKFRKFEKKVLYNTFVFILKYYEPSMYSHLSKMDFLNQYLEVLKRMNGFAIIKLEEINREIEIIEYFKKYIVETDYNDGNLDFVNGKYIKVKNGRYYCRCKGYVCNKERMMFLLDEGNVMEQIITCIHEMTHLSEGTNPYPLKQDIPFELEFRKMCCEGRAATREVSFTFKGNCEQKEILKSDSNEYVIYSDYSEYIINSDSNYPVYSYLYQMLQIIVGPSLMEELAHNQLEYVNMLDIIKERIPSISIEMIYIHIIYILSCLGNSKVFEESMNAYFWKMDKKREYIEKEWENLKRKIEVSKSYSQSLENEVKILRLELNELQNDTFYKTLLEIDLRKFSLEESFRYLQKQAIIRIREQHQDSLIGRSETLKRLNALQILNSKIKKKKQLKFA